MGDPRPHDELQRFWDAVLRGEPAPEGAPDPTLTETIRRLQALDRVPPPDAAFVARTRQELMAAPAPAALPKPNGRRPGTPNLVRWPARPAGRDRRRWVIAQVATAALLAITLVAAYLALIVGREEPADAPPTAVPPAPQERGAPTIEPLAATLFEEVPAAPALLALERRVFAPGVAAPAEAYSGTASYPQVYWVEAGAFTVRLRGPATVRRAARANLPASTEMALGSGDELTLHPGDSLTRPAGTGFLLRNDGEAVASLLTVEIVPGHRFGPGDPPGANYAEKAGLETTLLAGGTAASLPDGAVGVTLERRTYAPGQADRGATETRGAVAAQVQTGLLGYAVAAGESTLAVATPGAAPVATPEVRGVYGIGSLDVAGDIGPPTAAPRGAEVLLPAGSALFAQPGATIELRGAGDEPTVVLVAVVGPPEALDRP